jgi:hypothetical protein
MQAGKQTGNASRHAGKVAGTLAGKCTDGSQVSRGSTNRRANGEESKHANELFALSSRQARRQHYYYNYSYSCYYYYYYY